MSYQLKYIKLYLKINEEYEFAPKQLLNLENVNYLNMVVEA